MQLAIGEAPVSTVPKEVEGLFQAHHALVFRTAYRITGDATDAEDVMQTVFLRLLRRDAEAAELEYPESYLRRAAVNVALDLVRARHQAKSVPIDDSASRLALVSSSAADQDHQSRELRGLIRQALGRLSPRAAEIFALRYFEDLSNQQIARALRISQVYVAVTLHRSRGQLQKEIRSFLGGK